MKEATGRVPPLSCTQLARCVSMRRGFPMALAVLLTAYGCPPGRQSATDLSEEDQIREAVFRYQFECNASGLGQAANTYYLSVEGDNDPSPALLKQFSNHRPPVKPVSASTLESGTAQVVDKKSGLPGLVFRITDLLWLKGGEAEVRGGYEEASESGSGCTYRLAKQSGRWTVTSSKMLWIK